MIINTKFPNQILNRYKSSHIQHSLRKEPNITTNNLPIPSLDSVKHVDPLTLLRDLTLNNLIITKILILITLAFSLP